MFTPKKSTTQEIGDLGEEKASQYLKDRGYRILERNYKVKIEKTVIGELDIISKKSGHLIFVEVKSRFGQDNRYSPFDNITAPKKKQLIRLANFYIKAKKISLDSPWQIDVIAVEFNDNEKPKIEHLEKAVF
ncbi:YraN family protein [Candidatus Azambacteria bacterium]|nr:YraN family protein [Candidatus Azambacteria bacterium]